MNIEFLKKINKNPRWHSLMVLIIWIISLGILMSIVSIINLIDKPTVKNHNTEEKIKEDVTTISYEDKWQSLLNDNYVFNFTITNNTEIIKYNGIKKDNVINGYKEDKNKIIKYKIQNGLTYEILLNNEKIINNLYDFIDPFYIDVTYIYELIKNRSVEENEIDNINILEYNIEDLKITIKENDKEIINILIDKLNISYNLEFKKI